MIILTILSEIDSKSHSQVILIILPLIRLRLKIKSKMKSNDYHYYELYMNDHHMLNVISYFYLKLLSLYIILYYIIKITLD